MSTKLGSRENYFDVERGGYLDDEDADEAIGHIETAGVTWESYVAGTILRQNPDASVLCPRCLHEDDESVALSDPEDHVERSTVERQRTDEDGEVVDEWLETWYADHRRHRHCPSCSHVAFGGILQDVSTPSFMRVVDSILGALGDVPVTRLDSLRTEAKKRKQRGVGDEANIEQLLVDLRFGIES